jgi:glycosyltransferase involved in cell wall biosynthesis
MAGRLFQVLPSVMKRVGDDLEIDFDFSESLRLYMTSFDSVTVACPVSTDQDSGLRRCRYAKDLPWGDMVRFLPLPNAYSLKAFLREMKAVRRLLRSEIKEADYLVFSPHTLIGDWPTVAIREALRLERPYVIEADVVYEKVAQVDWDKNPIWKRLIKKYLMLPMFQQCHRHSLANSSLALFQGQDVYDAYASMCSNPHKVYHMPIDHDNYITPARLQKKLDGLSQGRPLRLCYVGRAIDMKGPLEWLKTVEKLNRKGVEISAVWMGDGSLLSRMRSIVEESGLAKKVTLPGYISDRREIQSALQDADIFLFCHKTPESPRCLVEALACGCPLIGYASAYPKELVAQHGGGQFAALGNWEELAEIVQDLDKNRDKLRDLIRSASVSGRLYERDATMQHRIDLINEYIKPASNTKCDSRLLTK